MQPGERVSLGVDGPFAGGISGREPHRRARWIAWPTGRAAPAAWRRDAAQALARRRRHRRRIGGRRSVCCALCAAPTLNWPTCVDWMGIAASLGADVPVCFAERNGARVGCRREAASRCRGSPFYRRCCSIRVRAGVPGQDGAGFPQAQGLPGGGAGAAAGARCVRGYAVAAGFHAARGQRPAARRAGRRCRPSPRCAQRCKPRAGCLYAGLSGAGPTCFGVYASEKEAAAAARSVQP